jgi:hypothetical protein
MLGFVRVANFRLDYLLLVVAALLTLGIEFSFIPLALTLRRPLRQSLTTLQAFLIFRNIETIL